MSGAISRKLRVGDPDVASLIRATVIPTSKLRRLGLDGLNDEPYAE